MILTSQLHPQMWEVMQLLRIRISTQLFADTSETQFKGSAGKL